MVIDANRSLTADHTGQIQLNANNITLDCAGHEISYTVANTTGCGSGGAQRCGIRAETRSGITFGTRYPGTGGNDLSGKEADRSERIAPGPRTRREIALDHIGV
jgi:hypothetical protein